MFSELKKVFFSKIYIYIQYVSYCTCIRNSDKLLPSDSEIIWQEQKCKENAHCTIWCNKSKTNSGGASHYRDTITPVIKTQGDLHHRAENIIEFSLNPPFCLCVQSRDGTLPTP
jgi:hypothetical protein